MRERKCTRGVPGVTLLEAAPREWRGGTHAHAQPALHARRAAGVTGSYPEEEFWQDLLKVTAGKTDEALRAGGFRESATVRPLMRQHGVRFQLSLSGTCT